MGNGPANLKVSEENKRSFESFKQTTTLQQNEARRGTYGQMGTYQTYSKPSGQTRTYSTMGNQKKQSYGTYQADKKPTSSGKNTFIASPVYQPKYQPKSRQTQVIEYVSPSNYITQQNTRISKLEEQENYLNETYGFPANIGKAMIHMDAYKFGWKPQFNNFDGKIICPCCKQNVQTIELNVLDQKTTIFSKEAQPFKLQSGVALFFTFIKYVIVLCLIRSLTVDIFNMGSSIMQGSYCEKDCSPQFYTYASVIYKYNREDLILTTNLFSLVTVVVLIIYFLIYRRLMYQIYDTIDSQNPTQDMYSIYVRDIPIVNIDKNDPYINVDLYHDLNQYFKGMVTQWLQNKNKLYNWFDDPSQRSLEKQYLMAIRGDDLSSDIPVVVPYDIVLSVNMCNDLTKIQKVHSLRQQLMDQYEELREDLEKLNEQKKLRYDTIPAHIFYLNGLQTRISQDYVQYANPDANVSHLIGSAFISFKYQHYRQFIIDKYQSDQKSFIFRGKNIKIQRAFHPTEIKWENLKLKQSERNFRTFLSFLILAVFLIVAFALLVVSDRFKNFLMEFIEKKGIQLHNPSLLTVGGMAVSITTTVVTLAINVLLKMFSKGLTEWECHQSTNNQKLSLTIKMVAAQFINTVIIYYFIALIVLKQQKNSMLSQNGLVLQVSSLVVTSGIIQIGTNAINVNQIIRKAKLRWYLGGFTERDEANMHQIRANKLYEYSEFDIAERYAYYILQLFTASFYSYLAPICAPAVAIICFIQYWIDKYNLFHRSSIDYSLSYTLSRNIVKISEISVLIYALGVLVFSQKINGQIHVFNIGGLIIAFIYIVVSLLLPYNYERKIFRSYQRYQKLSYLECARQGKFQKTFWDENPATRLAYESLFTGHSEINYQQVPTYTIQEAYTQQKRQRIKAEEVKYDKGTKKYTLIQKNPDKGSYNTSYNVYSMSGRERQKIIKSSYMPDSIIEEKQENSGIHQSMQKNEEKKNSRSKK